jgi:transcriptional regulator with XRE-family HTH domain
MISDAEILRKTLSANIKKYRNLLGISQEKLAEASDLSFQTIGDIEGCRTWVSDKSIVRLAKALQIEVYELLFPNTEAEKLYPTKVPADILCELQEKIKNRIDEEFSYVLTD